MRPALALSAEPNKDANVWTIRLRSGVTWHDGRPFTADDVVYTFHGWANPANFAHAATGNLIDFSGLRKSDSLTVEVPLVASVADFPAFLTTYNNFIIQDGTTAHDFKTGPQGTGPFSFVSFTPGQSSVFKRNPNYWESGKPYVDQVVVDLWLRLILRRPRVLH